MKSAVKYYYVYVITNLLLNKQYVGSKVCYKNDPYNDGYMGTSKYLNEDFKIYGLINFKKEIISFYDNVQDMLNAESEMMITLKTLAPNGYNRFIPNQKNGFHMAGVKQTKETIEKRNRWERTEEFKERQRQLNLGKHNVVVSKETKLKIKEHNSRYWEGKSMSEESKNKNRQKHLGKVPWNKGLTLKSNG